MALTVISGLISRKAAELSVSPTEVTAAALAKLAVRVRGLVRGLELPPAAQTWRFPAVSPGISLMRGREPSARCEHAPLFLVASFFTKAAGE